MNPNRLLDVNWGKHVKWDLLWQLAPKFSNIEGLACNVEVVLSL
jgi:hypothetical protein